MALILARHQRLAVPFDSNIKGHHEESMKLKPLIVIFCGIFYRVTEGMADERWNLA
jgi:hypothetical protein